MGRCLLLPNDPGFEETLGMIAPPGWRQTAARNNDQVVFLSDSETGILRPASPDEMTDYLYGGEYEERLRNSGQDDALDDLLITY